MMQNRLAVVIASVVLLVAGPDGARAGLLTQRRFSATRHWLSLARRSTNAAPIGYAVSVNCD